jgi:hypothetical protein
MAVTGVQVRRGVDPLCASAQASATGSRVTFQRTHIFSEPIGVSHFDQITCSPKITMVLGVIICAPFGSKRESSCQFIA